MENNTELNLAWHFIESTGTHLFLTGKAGTGKTTFLKQLKANSPKRMIVLAPTGIAAINAEGMTIHSFFQLPFAPYLPDMTFNQKNHYQFSKEKRTIINSIDLLVIDEISMVRADLLDAVDATLRRYRHRDTPFGGVQLLMIGDLQQLAPVVKDEEWELLGKYYDSPYFFDSHALKETNYMTIELKQVYRQQDTLFLSLLNKIRENKADEHTLAELNKRYIPNFKPNEEEGYIRLTTHNYIAQRINEHELSLINFPAFDFIATTEGTFPESSYPADEVLTLKEGAQIMFIKNDSSSEKRYYNGMIGEVVKVNQQHIFVRSKDSNNAFELEPEEWSNSKYVLDEETKLVTEKVEGVFRQYPIRLAWAITIHKSQGLTFERAIIDAGNSFAHGQTYVALSRCKTLEGLVLESPLRQEAIITDQKVDNFTKETEKHIPTISKIDELQRGYTLHLIKELFDLHDIKQAYQLVTRVVDEYFYKKQPELLEEYKALSPTLKMLMQVAQRFETQYTAMLVESNGDIEDKTLQERIHAAATYFKEKLDNFVDLHQHTSLVSDNKVIQKRAKERYGNLGELLLVKYKLLIHESTDDVLFSISDYLETKAQITIGLQEGETKTARKKKEKPKKEKVDTKKVSYDLYREGLTIEEIALNRGLVSGTIAGHLATYIAKGELDIKELVSSDKIDEIVRFTKSYPNKAHSLLAIKEHVSDTISYSDIKLVMAALEREA